VVSTFDRLHISPWNFQYRAVVFISYLRLTAQRYYVHKTCFRENRRNTKVICPVMWTYDLCVFDTGTYCDYYWQNHDYSNDVNKTRRSVKLLTINILRYLRGVYSDTTQLNSTDPVEQRTANSVVFLFMTSRPTNWVNCCSRCQVEFSWVQLSWVELCRYKHSVSHHISKWRHIRAVSGWT